MSHHTPSLRRRGATLGAVAALVLAGCATSTQTTDDDEEEPGGPVTLQFQTLAFQEPTIEATRQIVDDWNADNPDIQVEYVQGSWDSVQEQLVTQFQAGRAPDILHYESAAISGFAEQGYLADLSPYLSEETVAGVPEGVWETVTVDDEVIAAPTLLQSYLVFANLDLLEQAGVEVPTGETWAWDDFEEAARATTGGRVTGVGWGLSSPVATVTSLGLNFDAAFFEGSGREAQITIGDDELELVERIHSMAYEDGSLDTTSMTQSGGDVLPAWLAGEYAMTVQGSFAAQQIVEQAPHDFDWAVLPPLAGNSSTQAANPQTLSVAAESPHVEEAAAFIDYYMQADNLAAVAEGDWLIPASTEASGVVESDTGGENGWSTILASGDDLTQAPFQSVTNYPQWNDQIATPALQEYFGDRISLAELQARLTDGWAQVNGG